MGQALFLAGVYVEKMRLVVALTIELIIEGPLACHCQCLRRALPGGSLGLCSTFEERASLGIRFPG